MSSFPAHDLRQALALAIVRQKRRRDHELQQLRWELARVAVELERHQDEAASLRRAAALGLAGGRHSSEGDGSDALALLPEGWLPPLSNLAGAPCGDDRVSARDGGLALDGAARVALGGKARLLADMLLHNVRLLRAMRGPGDAAVGGGGACATRASASAGGWGPAGPAAEVAEFVAGTLLHAPVSSLTDAYQRECAAALAACLCAAEPVAVPGCIGVSRSCGAVALGAAAATEAAAAASDCSPVTATREVVGGLVAQVLGVAIPISAPAGGGAGSRAAAPPGPPVAPPEPRQTQARRALEALAALPPTGAVLLVGCALHLSRLCAALRGAAQAAAAGGGGGDDVDDGAAWAFEAGAGLFEASHELLELFQALCMERLPAWAPTLSATAPAAAGAGAACGGLLPWAVEGAAEALLRAHTALPALEPSFPLFVEGACGVAGALAASLQLVASGSGLCVGAGGPALRAACARQCVRLRDAFMPGRAS